MHLNPISSSSSPSSLCLLLLLFFVYDMCVFMLLLCVKLRVKEELVSA